MYQHMKFIAGEPQVVGKRAVLSKVRNMVMSAMLAFMPAYALSHTSCTKAPDAASEQVVNKGPLFQRTIIHRDKHNKIPMIDIETYNEHGQKMKLEHVTSSSGERTLFKEYVYEDDLLKEERMYSFGKVTEVIKYEYNEMKNITRIITFDRWKFLWEQDNKDIKAKKGQKNKDIKNKNNNGAKEQDNKGIKERISFEESFEYYPGGWVKKEHRTLRYSDKDWTLKWFEIEHYNEHEVRMGGSVQRFDHGQIISTERDEVVPEKDEIRLYIQKAGHPEMLDQVIHTKKNKKGQDTRVDFLLDDGTPSEYEQVQYNTAGQKVYEEFGNVIEEKKSILRYEYDKDGLLVTMISAYSEYGRTKTVVTEQYTYTNKRLIKKVTSCVDEGTVLFSNEEEYQYWK